jgi:hypothetical protein
LGKYIVERGADHFSVALSQADVAAIQELLLPIYGVGPKVIENFVELRRRRAGTASPEDGR